MPFPALLTRQLTILTDTLEDPATDLEAALSTLTGQLRAVVPGFLGLTITVHSSGMPVTLTAVDPAVLGSARGGLLLALPPAAGTPASDSVVFYAATPDAFHALIEGTDPGNDGLGGVYLLNDHLPMVTDLPHPVGISGLDEMTELNRAIGVLLAQDSTPGQAQRKCDAMPPPQTSPPGTGRAPARRPRLPPPTTQQRSPDADRPMSPTVLNQWPQARRPGRTWLPTAGSGRRDDSPDEVPRLRWPMFDPQISTAPGADHNSW